MKYKPNKDVEVAVSNYVKAIKDLTELKILRNKRNFQGEYAEWLLSKLDNPKLTLAKSSVQKGFDALDVNQNRYQIKSREVKSLFSNTSFDGLSRDAFDYLICVFFDENFNVLDILIIPEKIVFAKRESLQENKFRFRWTKDSYREYCGYSICSRENQSW
jgi:hypothetical protein